MSTKIHKKEKCHHCGSIISEREIGLYRGLIKTLWRVFDWSESKNIHEFKRKDIKHLFNNENDTARFGDLVYFGGLVYKNGKGHYGLNMKRCDDFFSNKYKIPTAVWKNPITKETRCENYVLLREMPSILEYLDEDGAYISRYRMNSTLF